MLTKLSTKFLKVRSHLFVSDNVKIGHKELHSLFGLDSCALR